MKAGRKTGRKQNDGWLAATTLERDSSAGLWGDDELQVDIEEKWIPSVEDILPTQSIVIGHAQGRNHILI